MVSVWLQLGQCHTGHSGKVSVAVYSERGTAREEQALWHLTWTRQMYALALSSHVQAQDTR